MEVLSCVHTFSLLHQNFELLSVGSKTSPIWYETNISFFFHAKLLCLHSFSSLFQYLLHRVFSPVGTEEADKCSWWAFRSDCRAQIKSETWWKDTFLFFLIPHALWHGLCLCVKRRNSAALHIWQSHTTQDLVEQMFRSYGCAAATESFPLEMKKGKKRKETLCISEQAEGLPSNLLSAAGWPGTSQWMYLVPRPLSTGVFTREDAKQESRAIQSYTSPAEHCVNAILPVMSEQIMNITLKL